MVYDHTTQRTWTDMSPKLAPATVRDRLVFLRVPALLRASISATIVATFLGMLLVASMVDLN